MKLELQLCLAALFVGVFSFSAQARTKDPAEAAFKEKFGQDVREVRRTRTTADDAEFAKRLLTEANSDKHDPALTLYIYEQSYEFGLRDARGYPTASQALDKLLEKTETRTYDIAEMRLALYEKWHEAEPERDSADSEALIDRCMQLARESIESDETDKALKLLNRVSRFATRIDSPRKNDVRDSISDLVRMRKTLEKIAELEEAMGTDPKAADKLAMIFLADLDDPVEAESYANQMFDQVLADKVRLAAMGFEFTTPDQASQAGAFYYSLVTESKTSDSIAMLIRARVWLTEYLSRNLPEDQAPTIKATKETLAEIDSDLLKRGIGKKLRRKLSSVLRGDGQFGRPADVQAAIDKAVEWLYTQHKGERHWEIDPANHRNYGGYTALVVYALLMADEEPKLNGDLSRAIYFMMNHNMTGVYGRCFRIHAWEVMPRRERYRQTLTQDVSWIRKAGTRHGFWGYTATGKDVIPGSRLDMSTTLAGGLGLWIGEAVGGISAKQVYWERTARALIDHQLEDNGWSYNPATMTKSTGSMTAAGLTLLHASYPHLGDVTKKQADKAIERGMKWMDENFSPTTNVNKGGRHHYYFAAVQHVGLFSGRKEFKELDWYDAIAEHLLKSQTAAGSWGTGVSDTAFAIAFLCRGGIVYEGSEHEEFHTESESESESETEAEDEAEPEVGEEQPQAADTE